MPLRVLLLNPWIYDFAAFDLWARPLGLLYLGAQLLGAGCEVRLVDCLDRLHPQAGAPRRRAGPPGTGPWAREVIPTPAPLRGIPRHYARYGLPEKVFLQDLAAPPRPDLVLVTSGMTYWYPGVFRAIALVREVWPETPVVLGGTYASLCPEHARARAGADLVVSGPGEADLLGVVAERTGEEVAVLEPEQIVWPGLWPALELYPRLEFAPLLTSRGCPWRCPYCAARRLFPGFVQRPVEDVVAEIEDRFFRLGLRDFVFFDDALLVGAEQHLVPLLVAVLRRGLELRFHVPNGLHLGLITPELARLMFEAGFATLRLGLETLDPAHQAAWGNKVAAGDFESALGHLIRAGFEPSQLGVYLLFGLPGQDLEEVAAAARAVRLLGARPHLAEFSPLPGTPLWAEAKQHSPFDLEGEPLFHNNSLFPCRGEDFSWERVWALKRAALA